MTEKNVHWLYTADTNFIEDRYWCQYTLTNASQAVITRSHFKRKKKILKKYRFGTYTVSLQRRSHRVLTPPPHVGAENAGRHILTSKLPPPPTGE